MYFLIYFLAVVSCLEITTIVKEGDNVILECIIGNCNIWAYSKYDDISFVDIFYYSCYNYLYNYINNSRITIDHTTGYISIRDVNVNDSGVWICTTILYNRTKDDIFYMFTTLIVSEKKELTTSINNTLPVNITTNIYEVLNYTSLDNVTTGKINDYSVIPVYDINYYTPKIVIPIICVLSIIIILLLLLLLLYVNKTKCNIINQRSNDYENPINIIGQYLHNSKYYEDLRVYNLDDYANPIDNIIFTAEEINNGNAVFDGYEIPIDQRINQYEEPRF